MNLRQHARANGNKRIKSFVGRRVRSLEKMQNHICGVFPAGAYFTITRVRSDLLELQRQGSWRCISGVSASNVELAPYPRKKT